MPKYRKATVHRKTTETQVKVTLSLDGSGRFDVHTTIPFLDHMLSLFAKHGHFDLKCQAMGDRHIDDHHLMEDIGIVLGLALEKALGSKKGIVRYGNFLLPMDETLSYVALDLSGRPYLVYQVKFRPSPSALDFELFEDFFQALAFNAKMNLHIKMLCGRNNHHMIESVFKGFARALDQAVRLDPRQKGIPSTKGSL